MRKIRQKISGSISVLVVAVAAFGVVVASPLASFALPAGTAPLPVDQSYCTGRGTAAYFNDASSELETGSKIHITCYTNMMFGLGSGDFHNAGAIDFANVNDLGTGEYTILAITSVNYFTYNGSTVSMKVKTSKADIYGPRFAVIDGQDLIAVDGMVTRGLAGDNGGSTLISVAVDPTWNGTSTLLVYAAAGSDSEAFAMNEIETPRGRAHLVFKDDGTYSYWYLELADTTPSNTPVATSPALLQAPATGRL